MMTQLPLEADNLNDLQIQASIKVEWAAFCSKSLAPWLANCLIRTRVTLRAVILNNLRIQKTIKIEWAALCRQRRFGLPNISVAT